MVPSWEVAAPSTGVIYSQEGGGFGQAQTCPGGPEFGFAASPALWSG